MKFKWVYLFYKAHNFSRIFWCLKYSTFNIVLLFFLRARPRRTKMRSDPLPNDSLTVRRPLEKGPSNARAGVRAHDQNDSSLVKLVRWGGEEFTDHYRFPQSRF